MNTPEAYQSKLIGQIVESADFDGENFYIVLSGGWSVNIWCEFSVFRQGQVLEIGDFSAIVGAKVIRFEQVLDEERILLSSEIEITALLSKLPPYQPESMMLRGPDALIVVWN